MNTIELNRTLRTNKIPSRFFKGVFPCNYLPKRVKRPACVIANTDPSYKSGTHWVAFFIPKKGPAEYFDSFGGYPVNKFFQKFLMTNSSVFINNKKRLQSAFASTCGYYCCMYLYWRCKGRSLRNFLNQFSSYDFTWNDAKVVTLYRKVYLKNHVHI